MIKVVRPHHHWPRHSHKLHHGELGDIGPAPGRAEAERAAEAAATSRLPAAAWPAAGLPQPPPQRVELPLRQLQLPRWALALPAKCGGAAAGRGPCVLAVVRGRSRLLIAADHDGPALLLVTANDDDPILRPAIQTELLLISCLAARLRALSCLLLVCSSPV